MKAKELGGSTVTLKLKTSDFRLLTRARSISSPTNLAGRIYQAARALIEPELARGPYRLIGVGMSELVPARGGRPRRSRRPIGRREAGMERAVDELRARFGHDAITRGLVFGARPPADKPRRS